MNIGPFSGKIGENDTKYDVKLKDYKRKNYKDRNNRINKEDNSGNNNVLALNFNPQNITQGIILSEILGKPKSLRRR